MLNKNGFDIGDGECPCTCNDGVACDWIGSHWKNCWIYKEYKNNIDKAMNCLSKKYP